MDTEERELVRRVIENVPGAGDEFVTRYRERIYAVSVAVLGWQDPEAADAVQETFVAALNGLKGFEFRSSLYTWLNQICVRQCYRRIRTFRIGTVTGSLCRMGLDAVPFLLPLFFQVGFGLSPLQSGLLSFSSSLGAMLVRTLAGTLLRFFGFRRLLVGNA